MGDGSPNGRLPDLPIDWDAVEGEATELLRRYLRIDTTNPPGGEEAGAQLLAEALRRDGVEPEFYQAGDGRLSVSARLPGTNGAGTKPLVLLSHVDVVPVDRAYWDVDPYAGLLLDGVVWGRGALDMKGMGVMALLVFLLLKRHRVAHRRDVLFLAVADEEAGGHFGMGWLAAHRPELLAADGVITEGAYGFSEFLGHRGLIFGVASTEKAPCWLRLTTRGRPGHASLPHQDNCAMRLTRALARLGTAKHPLTLRPEMELTIETLKHAGVLPQGLDARNPAVLAAAAEHNDLFRALLTNTVTLTALEAGTKQNVIPAEASAALDCRLLPGEDVDAFVHGLREIIDDAAVEIEMVYSFEPLVSAIRTELVEHVEATIRHETAGGVVMPMICPAFTDGRFYRRAGVPAIGYTPVLLTLDEVSGVHGHNERLSTQNLRLGTRLLLDTVRRAAGVP